MRILAIDTATEACSAAVLSGDTLVSRNSLLGRAAAESILGLVDEVLVQTGTTLKDLDAVAFGRGPGSFTGVRLAVGVAQGLAFGAGLPVVGVSDLRALAQQALDASSDSMGVVVCNDARMHEVYWAFCARDREGLARLVEPERVGRPDTVQLPLGAQTPVLGVGTGFRAYPELGRLLQGKLTGIRAELLPRADEVARLAKVELLAGRAVPPEQALPVYLREQVAMPPSHE